MRTLAVEFVPGDQVYLRVTPLKGTKRFHVKGKLAPRFIGPFKITARRGEVAYQLELPPELSGCAQRVSRVTAPEVLASAEPSRSLQGH